MVKDSTRTIFDVFWAAPWVKTPGEFYVQAATYVDLPGIRTLRYYLRAKDRLFELADEGLLTRDEAVDCLIAERKQLNISGDGDTKELWRYVVMAHDNYNEELKKEEARDIKERGIEEGAGEEEAREEEKEELKNEEAREKKN